MWPKRFGVPVITQMRTPITRVTVKSKDLPATLVPYPQLFRQSRACVKPVPISAPSYAVCPWNPTFLRTSFEIPKLVRQKTFYLGQTVTVTAFVRRAPCSHGRFLISSPIATPTPLRLSPRQTSQPTFHFVPSKTFFRNKTHQDHHFVPLNRFIWDKNLRFSMA